MVRVVQKGWEIACDTHAQVGLVDVLVKLVEWLRC